jgi:radical SAM protein (TIGR01212 family)
MQRYNDYTSVLKKLFAGRVQKITVNAGFTCPNRDGTKGVGGCTYCNNQSFSPEYCHSQKTVSEQIEEGIRFFDHKYKGQKYLVYFQSYTNTYDEMERLVSLYEEALSYPQVAGLVVGTRPDCVSNDLLEYFADLATEKYVMIEYGVESTSNETLKFINRGHSYEEAEEIIRRTAEKGIFTGVHLILGLPGETREMILSHADKISQLPITAVKLHQLQLIKGTKMAAQYEENPEIFNLYSSDEYIDLVIDFLERLNPYIAVERFVSQSPKSLLIAPDWGLKNFEFMEKVKKRLVKRDTWQGKNFKYKR